MKIALINENSQAAKNGIIEAALKKVVEPMGHEVVNYGMYAADDKAQLTYVQCGILAAILLNSGAADYVITGCGTGQSARSGTASRNNRNNRENRNLDLTPVVKLRRYSSMLCSSDSFGADGA